MTITNLITPLTNTITQQRKMLLEVERFLVENPGIFNYLTIHELVTKIELTPDYLIFHPAGDSVKLTEFFLDCLECIFTRTHSELNTYQWDTVPPEYNFILRIQANEVIDLTGTSIHMNVL